MSCVRTSKGSSPWVEGWDGEKWEIISQKTEGSESLKFPHLIIWNTYFKRQFTVVLSGSEVGPHIKKQTINLS